MPAETAQPNTTLVDIELRDGIAILTLNRPDKRNAINDDMRADLISALDWTDRSPVVAAVVLTGRGKGFCAGGDIAAMRERLSAPAGRVGINGWQRQRRTHHLLTMLHDIPKPTIAAVNGAAAGLGADLALCCDFVIGASDATFVMSYVLRGLIPDGGGMYFLPRRVGLARAKELIFSGRKIGAEEAKRINMIERVSDPGSLIDDAVEMAKTMTVGSSDALALAKSIMNESYESTAEEIFALGSQAQGICYTTDTHRDAVAVFLDKRK
ncbi:MAG: enoyl-CoA hydratase/isomerase family protein [Pseudomonadota bacterium]|nr:enoyl-CoA hydratase/isomerase family protein [Pseudomonadota bacterium]